MANYAVTVRFNGRVGGRSVHTTTVEADSPFEAVDTAVAEAARSPRGGGSIFVTGYTVDEVPE